MVRDRGLRPALHLWHRSTVTDVPGPERKQQTARGPRCNLPGIVSTLRLAAIPVVLYFAGPGKNLRIVFWTCLAAALSDYFDGILARRLSCQSYRGKVLDFTCDKLFLSVALLVVWRPAGGDPTVIGALVCYHLLVLLVMTIISWGVGKPLVSITTGEKLVVIFSYVLVVSMAGKGAFPGKGIYSTLVWIGGILSLTAMLFGVVGYLRLVRRFLRRFSRQ